MIPAALPESRTLTADEKGYSSGHDAGERVSKIRRTLASVRA